MNRSNLDIVHCILRAPCRVYGDLHIFYIVYVVDLVDLVLGILHHTDHIAGRSPDYQNALVVERSNI